MEENQELKRKTEEIGKKIIIFHDGATSLLYSLPLESQNRVRNILAGKYINNGLLVFRIPVMQDFCWSISITPFFGFGLALASRGVGHDITCSDGKVIYDLLVKEAYWREIINFIEMVIRYLNETTNKVFQEEIQKLSPEAFELSRRLKASQETMQNKQKEINLLEEEKNSLRQSKDNLERVVATSAIQLQEVAQNLRNTRTFLGQSKTIKGIRQRVEKVILDLWKAVHPDQIPPVGIQPPEPWPEPPQEKQMYRPVGAGHNPPHPTGSGWSGPVPPAPPPPPPVRVQIVEK